MFKVKRGEQYGDFRAVKKLDKDEGGTEYGCTCVHCGVKKRYTRSELRKSPTCDCQRIESVAIVKARGRLEKLTASLELPPEEEISETYSKFLEEVETINARLEELESDDPVRRFQLASLKTLVDLVPHAERAYRSDPRQSHAYSLNAIISQIRELAEDLNATDDKNELIERVLTGILHPAFLQIAQVIIDNFYMLRKEIEPDIIPERRKRTHAEIDSTMRSMAKSFQDIFYDIKNKTAELE